MSSRTTNARICVLGPTAVIRCSAWLYPASNSVLWAVCSWFFGRRPKDQLCLVVERRQALLQQKRNANCGTYPQAVSVDFANENKQFSTFFASTKRRTEKFWAHKKTKKKKKTHGRTLSQQENLNINCAGDVDLYSPKNTRTKHFFLPKVSVENVSSPSFGCVLLCLSQSAGISDPVCMPGKLNILLFLGLSLESSCPQAEGHLSPVPPITQKWIDQSTFRLFVLSQCRPTFGTDFESSAFRIKFFTSISFAESFSSSWKCSSVSKSPFTPTWIARDLT